VPRHDRDVKWDAMASAVRGEVPVFFHVATLAQIEDVLDLVDRQQLTKVVLVGSGDVWRVADELKRRDIAVVTAGNIEPPVRRDATYDEVYALPGRLAKAGVRFCIADQGGADDAMNARNLTCHASAAMAYGLSADEALESVTLYPAQILGVADRLGSIEVGKVADLLVADGDPLEITTHVEQVYINGKPSSMENRQTRLFHKYDARPRGAKARKR
jgi:imidazolonepropionase-like amidohydrolase